MFSYYLGLAAKRCCVRPAITLLIILTLSIGVAACMTTGTIFAALDGEPLPGISNHLYVATMDAREKVAQGNASYLAPDSSLKLRDATALVDGHYAAWQAAVAQTFAPVVNPENAKSSIVNGLMAYGSVLNVFGVPLRYGRPWTAEEQASRAPVVVIDTALAERLFGTEDAVGRALDLYGHRFTVVGVADPWKPRVAFLGVAQHVGSLLAGNTQLFVPVSAALDAGLGPAISGECDNDIGSASFGSVDVGACRWLELWVFVNTQSEADGYGRILNNYAMSQHKAGRFVNPPRARLFRMNTWLAWNHVVPADVSLNLIFATTFLLLCMMNVAGLLAARYLRRMADVAIRRALGASVRQIFVQHLIESGLLGVTGGCIALPLTLLGMWIVRKQPVGYAPIAHFSLSAFVSLTVLSIIVGMTVGILPAWRVCRLPPAVQIKES